MGKNGKNISFSDKELSVLSFALASREFRLNDLVCIFKEGEHEEGYQLLLEELNTLQSLRDKLITMGIFIV